MSHYQTMNQARLPQAVLEPGVRPTRQHYQSAALRLTAHRPVQLLLAERYLRVARMLEFVPAREPHQR